MASGNGISEKNKVVYRLLKETTAKSERVLSEVKIENILGEDSIMVQKIKIALKEVSPNRVLEGDIDNLVDAKSVTKIKKKLLTNPEAVLDFIKEIKFCLIREATRKSIPTTNASLNKFAKLTTIKDGIIVPKDDVAETKMLDMLQQLETSSKFTIDYGTDQDDLWFSATIYVWGLVSNVMEKCNIKRDFLPIPDQWMVTYTQVVTKRVLEEALANLWVDWQETRTSRHIHGGNVAPIYKGASVPIEIAQNVRADTTNDNKNKLSTLRKVYVNDKAREQERGLINTLDNTTVAGLVGLPNSLVSDDAKMLEYLLLSSTEMFSILGRYLEDNPNPKEIVTYEELAAYHEKYRKSMSDRNVLPQFYRERMFILLQMALGGWNIRERQTTSSGQQFFGFRRLKVFEFVPDENMSFIANLRYTDEYIKWRKGSGSSQMDMLLPTGLDLLSDQVAKIAHTIHLLFVEGKYIDPETGKQRRRQSATLDGLPVIVSIQVLAKNGSYTIPERGDMAADKYAKKMYKFRNKIYRALNDILKTEQFIERWEKIEGTDNVRLYPAQYLIDNLTDRKRRAARNMNEEKEQERRRKELEEYIDLMREDFKFKTNPREYLETAAEELGVTEDELGAYRLSKGKSKKSLQPTPISDEMYAKIKSGIESLA